MLVCGAMRLRCGIRVGAKWLEPKGVCLCVYVASEMTEGLKDYTLKRD